MCMYSGKSKRWFIDIDCEEVREFMNQRDIETENKDTKLSSRLEELEMKINEILKKTNSLQQQQNDIADERHKMTTLNTTANT